MKRAQNFTAAIFLLGILFYMYISFQRAAIPGQIFNELTQDFSLSASKLTTLSSVYMLIYALMQLPGGILVQRYGGVRIMIACAVFLTIGSLIFPYTHVFGTLLFARILLAIGCSLIYQSMVDITDKAYNAHYTTLIGTICLCGYITSAAGTVPFVCAVQHFGWRMSLIVPALLIAIVTVFFIFLSHFTEKSQIRQVSFSAKPFWKCLKNRNDLLLIGAYATNYGIYFSVLAIFGKKFLEDTGKLSPSVASFVSMIILVAPALYNQISGIISTKIGNRRLPFIRLMGILGISSNAVMLVALLVGDFPGRGFLFAIALTAMSLVAGLTAIISSTTKEYSHEGALPILTAIINFVAYAVVFVFGSISGAIMDIVGGTKLDDGTTTYSTSAYVTIFLIFLIISLITCRMAFKVPETKGKNILR